MTTYYITSTRPSETGYWQPVGAATLRGAKCAAQRQFGSGYHDATLLVAVGDDVVQPRQVVARKAPDARWETQS